MIVCAAIVGQQNNPLYIECFDQPAGADPVALHFLVHCALDAVEEKANTTDRKRDPASLDPYLGSIYPTEKHKVFAYITNCKTKFLLVIDTHASQLRDEELRTLFKRLHMAYVDAVSNPFVSPEAIITSSRFDTSVRAIVSGSSG